MPTSEEAICISTTACTVSETLKLTNNSVVLQEGQTASWSITGGTGNISGLNNQSDVKVVWSSLPGTVSLTVNDTSGCSVTATQNISSDCSGLSVDGFEKERSSVVIYPNPPESLINITLEAQQSGTAAIVLKSIDAKILMRHSVEVLSGKQTLEMVPPANLQGGIVLFHISLPDFRTVKKVVIN